MKNRLIALLLMSLPFLGFAQDADKPSVKFSGFVKNDAFVDTRQTVAAREGHFLLYPADQNIDSTGTDINEGVNFNMLAIQSRLRAKVKGPDAFGAKTSGMVEGAFFGNINSDVNGFRLRHAFGKLNWESTELLFGQYWHPMFVTGCFPGTISFSTGVPFQPFSRNPQLRLTKSMGGAKIILAAMSQRDFASTGGSTSLRNSGIPDMQLQFQYGAKNDSAKTSLLAGFGGGYKVLKPGLSTAGDSGLFATDETIASMSAQVFIKYKMEKLAIKLQGSFGQNMTDMLMLGGYAIKDTTDYVDEYLANGTLKYTTVDVMSAWLDIDFNLSAKVKIGLFSGYTKNLGSSKNILDWTNTASIAKGGSYNARGSNIAYVYRIAPRVAWVSGKTKIAIEVDYTNAGYGDSVNSLGVVDESTVEDVANIRGLLSMIYSF